MKLTFDPSNRAEVEFVHDIIQTILGAQPQTAEQTEYRPDEEEVCPSPPQPEPKSPPQPEPTADREAIEAKVRALVDQDRDNIPRIRSILEDFGAERVSALDPSDYDEFFKRLCEL